MASMSQSGRQLGRQFTTREVCLSLGIKRGSLPLRAARAGVKPLLKIIRGRATALYTRGDMDKIRAEAS